MIIRDKICNIFADYGYDINDQNSLYEIDSLSNINIIIDIEDEFNIEIPDEYLDKKLLINISALESIIKSLKEN
ncbi:MAG: phosphopantetheine-binding protein [Acholeplasma sp.]|nr:phosphopantetheine-binding protein [Acholeplasma sp.]